MARAPCFFLFSFIGFDLVLFGCADEIYTTDQTSGNLSEITVVVLIFNSEAFVGEARELLDDLYLGRVIRESSAGAVEIVLPLREVDMLDRIVALLLILAPYSLRGLVGLIFSGNEAPLIASDLFKEEEGEHLLDGISVNTAEPFGIKNRSIVLFELLNYENIFIVGRITVIADNVGVIEGEALHLGGRSAVLHSAPYISAKRLNRIYLPAYLEELFKVRKTLRASAVTGLVHKIPDDNSLITLILGHYLSDHLVILGRNLGIIEDIIAVIVTVLIPYLEVLTAVISGLPELLAKGCGYELGASYRALIRKNHHSAYAVAPSGVYIAIKPIHKAVVLLLPDLVLDNNADGVIAYRLHKSELTLSRYELFLKSVFLPLIDTVSAIAAHKVTASYPGLRVIPFPSLFL